MSLLLRIAFLLIGFSLPAMAQTVGVASAVSGEPRGTPPAQNERILRVGIDVFSNERVRTGANDRAHLVFTDGSALSVGVNSEITIDRFVCGAISKKTEVKVTTPAGNIGIRGGIVTISIGSDGSATITFLYGEYASVTNAGGIARAIRAGSQIFVPYNGAPFPPIVLPPGSLQAYLALFEKQQGTGTAVSPGDQ